MKAGSFAFAALLVLSSLFGQDAAQSKLASITGSVTDSLTEQGVAKAVLTLQPLRATGEKDEGKSATTDPAGHYEFHDVPAGEYYLTVTNSGYLHNAYGRKSRFSRGTPIGVSEGKALSGMDLKLERAAVISGRVLDEDGEPFPNVQVMALQYHEFRGKRRLLNEGRAETDDRGEYRVHDLSPGNYYVSCHVDTRRGPVLAEANGKKAYPTTYYPSAASVDNATAVLVTAGSEGVANFALTSSPAYTVRGNVTGAADNTDLTVMLMPSKLALGSVGFEPTLVKNRSFEVKGVLPGSYSVVAISYADGKQSYASRKITVSDADLNDVTVAFKTTTIEIHGALQVLGDQKPDLTSLYIDLTDPVAGAQEENDDDTAFMYFGGGGGSSRIKKEGTFTVTTVPDAHKKFVAVYAQGAEFSDWYTKSVFFGTQDVTDTGFTPAAGASLQLFLSPYGASVEGVVSDKDGHPVSGAQVFTVPEEGRRQRHDLYQSGVSDQRGYFHIRGVPPANYRVLALDDPEGQSVFDSEFLKTNFSKGTELKVEEKGKYNIAVTLIPSAPDTPAK